jgi:nucleoside-diphosphate-sugar epimerase
MHQNKKSIKALITGASGFIGGHLAEALIRKGWDVYALTRKETDPRWLESREVKLVHADYQDKPSLNEAVKGMDYVFHLGAVIAAPKWEDYHRANVQATENLLAACQESCPGLKKFVFVSSISAAGVTAPGQAKTEADPCTPISYYGRSKLEAEERAAQYMERVPIVIVRPPNVLGPRQNEIKTMLETLEKRIFPLLGNGDKQTSIIFVEDLVRALIMAAEKKEAEGQTYFVTDNRHYSWREILDFIAVEMGIRSFMIKIPYPLLYIIAVISSFIARLAGVGAMISRENIVNLRKQYWLYDSQKIEKELGFAPAIKFEDGMREIIAWYRSEKNKKA